MLTGLEKNFNFYRCTTVNKDRRAKILKTIINGLRFLPIAVDLHSQVILPPAYISYTQKIEYVNCDLNVSTISLLIGGQVFTSVQRS
jgi:hypothetical protein